MAKKTTAKKNRRARQPQRRTVRTGPPPPDDTDTSADDDTPLVLDADMLGALRLMWRSPDPYDLLVLTSGFIMAADPRQPRRRESEQKPLGLSDLVDPFLATSYAETTAALHMLRVLIEDETQTARIDRELAQRRQRMPTWITGLPQRGSSRRCGR